VSVFFARTSVTTVVGDHGRGDNSKEPSMGCRDLTAIFLVNTEEARYEVSGFGPAVTNGPGTEPDGYVVGIIERARQGRGLDRPGPRWILVFEVGFEHIAREDARPGWMSALPITTGFTHRRSPSNTTSTTKSMSSAQRRHGMASL
jgi:hypothetical protein